jgi:hypothetical protein
VSRRDNNGVLIEVGDYVAYNHSGHVSAGYVTYVPDRSGVGAIKIERVVPARRYPRDNMVSRVRHGCSILVLDRDQSSGLRKREER